jgi:hypothetical protein
MKNVLFWLFIVISTAINVYLLVQMEMNNKVTIEVVDMGNGNPEENDYTRGYHAAIEQVYNDKNLLLELSCPSL